MRRICCCCLDPSEEKEALPLEESRQPMASRDEDQSRSASITPPTAAAVAVEAAGSTVAASASANSSSGDSARKPSSVTIDVKPAGLDGLSAITAALSGGKMEFMQLQQMQDLPGYSAKGLLTHHQQKRARDLAAWPTFDLGWRLLPDTAPNGQGKFFYFNTWSGVTSWKPEARIAALRTRENQTSDLRIPGSLEWVQPMLYFFQQRGVQVMLWNDDLGRQRNIVGRHRITGERPNLWHTLFYAHVMMNEFGLYPLGFLRSLGLRRIVLADSLVYDGQPRTAIPLIEVGTLLLDPRLEEITYVTNVLHHELFHMIDCAMIWRSENHSLKRSALRAEVTRRGDFEDRYDDKQREFDFTTEMDATEVVTPLAPHELEAVCCLHGVKDNSWAKLNPPTFKYGNGGAQNRDKHAFLSGGRGGCIAGFLNAYSQSAVEEDKAEVFAALIRNARAMQTDPDLVIRSKAKELRRRLEWFCHDMRDAAFWESLSTHTPHKDSSLAGDAATAHRWVSKQDHLGNYYWFNEATKVTTWTKPEWLHASASPASSPEP